MKNELLANCCKTFILLVSVLIVFNSCKKKEASPLKPNVLFIFADDQREDALGCSGNPYIETPNIDKLAERGVRFTHNYVMGGHIPAVCAPSRAQLMSGKSLFHVYDHLEGVTTMPQYFGQNGYETFGTGKWHNTAQSFERSFQNGENVFLGGMADHNHVPCYNMTSAGKLEGPVDRGFSTDVFAGAALNFLRNYASGKRETPFFCYVAFTAPHDPRSPRGDYIGMYDEESLPLPGNFKKYHPFAFDNMKIRDEVLAPWPRTPEIIRASLADYYALISHLDKRVGDILELLEKEGLVENTIVIYSADNGLAIGSHGLLGKQNLYEHSTNVPLIIAGPGIPKEKVTNAFVYLYDLFPTLCDLAGLPAPENVDGQSLAPVMKDKPEPVRPTLFTVYRNTVRAVRDRNWKLIQYPGRNYTQLFHLANDPLELHNLAEQPGYESKVNEMMNLLKEWQKNTDDTASLTSPNPLPLEYNPLEFERVPDKWQPEYTLKKYFDVGE